MDVRASSIGSSVTSMYVVQENFIQVTVVLFSYILRTYTNSCACTCTYYHACAMTGCMLHAHTRGHDHMVGGGQGRAGARSGRPQGQGRRAGARSEAATRGEGPIVGGQGRGRADCGGSGGRRQDRRKTMREGINCHQPFFFQEFGWPLRVVWDTHEIQARVVVFG